MFKKILLFVLLLFFLPVSQAFPWGAVNYWCPTHQLILKEAYNLLSQDPAFQGSNFLSMNNILAHEGVTLRDKFILDFSGIGPGPDSDDATPYSWHYYNPLTPAKGFGPEAVLQYYRVLLDPNISDEKAQAAAWSAHFLADMSVPYHIVGMPKKEAYEYHADGKRYLDEKLTGPVYLYDHNASGLLPPAGWGKDGDFWDAIVNYSYYHSRGKADWFDPWYANGSGYKVSLQTGMSSHVLWENRAHEVYDVHPHFHWGIFPAGDGRYNPVWQNGPPPYGFTADLLDLQAKQSASFARAVALFTRNNILQFHRSPEIGIDHSIRNVATLWRSTFSGLRAKMFYHEKISDDPHEYGIECRIGNTADAPAMNVQVELNIFHNRQLVYTDRRGGGTIGAGESSSVQFNVKVQPDTAYSLATAVVARYGIPDLQYAFTNDTFTFKAAKPEREYLDEKNDPLIGTWRWFTGSDVAFHENHTMQSTSGNSGRWQQLGKASNVYELRWSKGSYIDTLTLSSDRNTLKGTNQHGHRVTGYRKR